MKASFLTDVFLPTLTVLAMLGLGASLTVVDFKRLLVYPKALFIGLLNQLLFVPVVGILLALVLPLNPELAVGLIILAAVPGGVSSNVTTYLLRGHSALSVSLTAVSNLLAIVTLPLWITLGLYLFVGTNKVVSVSPAQIIVSVAVLTLIPVGLGIAIRMLWPQVAHYLRHALRYGLGLLLIVAIVGYLVGERDNLLYYLAQAGEAAILLCLITFLLGYVSAALFKLDIRTRITIANESGIQNVALALTLTASILANPLIAITPAAYGLVQILFYFIILVIAFGPWSSHLLSKQVTVDKLAPR